MPPALHSKPLRFVVSRRFRRLRDVLAASRLEDLLRLLGPLAVVTVDRQEVRALAHAPGIALRFHLRDASADQAANETASGSGSTSAGQCSHNRAGRDD